MSDEPRSCEADFGAMAGAAPAKPLANQCSALVRTAADANAIVTVCETAVGSTVLHRGDVIDVEVFDWSSVFRPSCDMHLAKEAAA